MTQLGGEQTDHTLSEDRNSLAGLGCGGQHRVQGDRADPVERADQRIEAGRQPMVGERRRRAAQHESDGPRCPRPPRRPQVSPRPYRADLDDADLGVAPDVERIAQRRRTW